MALAGFELESFKKTLAALERVHRHFEDVLPVGDLEALQPVSIGGLAALACHTRYFTPRRNCLTADHQPFGPGIDPNGTLEGLKGAAYVHTEDNVVQYLGIKRCEDGIRYEIS